MKKKGVLLLIVIILILLPGALVSSEGIKEDSEKVMKRIGYQAEQFDAGNDQYAQTITNINKAEDDLNLILGTPDEEDPKEDELKEVFGEPEETYWAYDKEEGTQKKFEEPLSTWKNVLIYDGELHVEANIAPVITKVDEEEIITYESDISVDFSDEELDLSAEEATSEISRIKTLAQTYKHNPSDLQAKDQLAREASNLHFRFKEYIEQSTGSCEEFFMGVLGPESVMSKQRVITNTYTILKDEDQNIETIAIMSFCEKCERSDYWVDIKFEFIGEDGKTIDYHLLKEPSESLYKDAGENTLKKETVRFMNMFIDLINEGGYNAAHTIGSEIGAINKAWNSMANEDKSQAPLEFLERLEFYSSIFEGYTSTTEFSEQIEFQKNLFKEVKEGGEEICDNGIDDNEDGDQDCEDVLCNGEICGIDIINEGNETNETTTVQLYCIEGECKQKEEVIETPKNITCGNGICEEGEIDSCIVDCVTCPERAAIPCQGDVIFKGKDANGCDLEPICLEESKSCETVDDCEKPLCGEVQCIEGECHTTSLKQCTQAKCDTGEKRIQVCKDGEELITEICSEGVWKETGQSCEDPSEEPIQTFEEEGQVCEKKEDCPNNEVCSNGFCKSIAKNIEKEQETSSETIPFTGTTSTGKVVPITGQWITGEPFITGVSREGVENLEVFKEPQEYEIERERGEGSSPFTTHLGPSKKEQEELAKIERKTPPAAPTIDLPEHLEDIYAVRGVCIKTNEGEKALMFFDGAGKDFAPVSNLQQKYNEENIAYCNLKLKQALEKRKEFEASDEDFPKWFFEKYVASDNEWEKKQEELEGLFREIEENLENIARNMDCLGIKETEFKLINMDYGTAYGSLEYKEEIKNVKLPGMYGEVRIPSPVMKISVIPNKEFVKSELITAMTNSKFVGSEKGIHERNLGKGLTLEEKADLREDVKLVEKIKNLAQQQADKSLDFQLTIIDYTKGEEIVYNVYGRLSDNEDDLIRFIPMPPEMTPAVSLKITASFDEIFKVIEEKEKNSVDLDRRRNSKKKINPIRVLESTIKWINMRRKIGSMMNSVEFNPKMPGVEDITRKMFYIIAGERDYEPEEVDEKETIFRDSEGKEIKLRMISMAFKP
jgi:hypothetical protein